MGRWEALSRVVEARAVEHACFGQPTRHSRRAFKRVKQFQAIVAADLTHAQRREAMRRVCARELQAAAVPPSETSNSNLANPWLR